MCSITENTWRSCGVSRTCRAQNTRSSSHLLNLIERVWVDKHTYKPLEYKQCHTGHMWGRIWLWVEWRTQGPLQALSSEQLHHADGVQMCNRIADLSYQLDLCREESIVLLYQKTLHVHHSVIFHIVNHSWLTCTFIWVVVMHFKPVEKITNISSNWKSCHLRKIKSLEKYIIKRLLKGSISNYYFIKKVYI